MYTWPQSGDFAAAGYSFEYGDPGPTQTTVIPSPMSQVTDLGVPVAITLSPGTTADAVTGFHVSLLTHIQVGTPTTWVKRSSGLSWIDGFGSRS
ncbi:hypothetical protein SRB5_70780 [Streptomyces sp. RB5]|uniref:Uncharacterized protein n=1 Tax=Streptomyces smaragdinus TaxID=2585196 RepID=A0A7K0CTR1_9ACTN|nr:hypothetical protein [Streptomyces smaragdinus]